jgi:excisionase family DNA binding protein
MKLYTVKKAAQIIGCSTNTLYKYLNEGRIKASRGTANQGRFRIPQSSLEEFLGAALEPAGQPIISPTGRSLPLTLVRILIVIGLILILIDSLIIQATPLPIQFSRLTFLAIALLLAYQQGGYLRR